MLLKASNLLKHFAGPAGMVRALDDISLELDAGQFMAVEGESGCGKTTLLLVAGGLLRPDGGRLEIGDQDPYALAPDRRAAFRARHVGFVFQQFHLVPYLNVLENVLAPTLAATDGAARDRAMELVRQLRLEDRTGHTPAMLSTGERQRTAIARAMLMNPQVLLADEPTGNLDHENAEIVLEYLLRFAAEGGAVLLVTHDQRAAAHAQRRIRMARGKLCPA